MPDLLTANGTPITEGRIAMHIMMTTMTGAAATDECLRAHGVEPSTDRVQVGRQHVEVHGGEVTAAGGIRWPHPQSPSLSRLLGLPSRETHALRLRRIAEDRDRAATRLVAQADQMRAEAASLRAEADALEPPQPQEQS